MKSGNRNSLKSTPHSYQHMLALLAVETTSLAAIAAATAKQKRLQEFDRFDPEFVDLYKQERDLKKMPKREAEAQ